MRRRVLITGASSGLGAEMARQFAARGHDLALCARRAHRLEALRGELTAAHPHRAVAWRALDVDDHDAVFRVFGELRDELGGLDRVVVNAGLGKGAAVGTGRFDANRQTVMTNLVSGLAQCEAAMEIFRAAGDGHLVVVSSMSALRGLPKNLTAYAASKAGIAAVAEGIRAEMLGSPVNVTTLFPGYIASEMNERVTQRTPLMVSTEKGVRAMVSAIDREVATAMVPRWPWLPLSVVMRHAPLRFVGKFA
jgi:short-subunit dehydrogenase